MLSNLGCAYGTYEVQCVHFVLNLTNASYPLFNCHIKKVFHFTA